MQYFELWKSTIMDQSVTFRKRVYRGLEGDIIAVDDFKSHHTCLSILLATLITELVARVVPARLNSLNGAANT